jgi:hypothetical protein
VTAKLPAIMIPAGVRARWRIAWAQRENDRRWRAYDADAEVWLRRNDELIRLQIEATGFLGCTQPRNGLPVDLDDDEVVFRVLPAAELVEAEARHVPGMPTPGLTAASAGTVPPGRALPKGLRVVDAGMAVVTNHRVAFSGREGRREWTYADMVGPAHHFDVPLTVLHTTDGRRLAGLLVPATAIVNFRFYLTLAFAAATGERAAVAAQLDALMDTHQDARPVPPPPAEPDQAPLTALRPNRRAATVMAVAAVAFAMLTASTFGSEQAGLPYRAEVGESVVVATATDAPNAISVTAPPDSGNPVAPGGDAAAGTGVVEGPTAGGATGENAPIARPETASQRRSVPRVVPAMGPASLPPPTTGPASPTSPAPTAAPPSPEPLVVDLCGSAKPLRLPVLQPLLCPPASP